MRRPLAGLFVCSVISGCGGSGSPATGVINPPGPPPAGTNLALRFFGTGSGDIDRVKIALTNGAVSLPVNTVGTQDLTLEFWIKGTRAENPTPACTIGPIGNGTWMNGAVVIDRDVSGDGDFGEYGVALFAGQLAFGVSRDGTGETACGATDVLDGAWHHVAFTRQLQTGQLKIFVDGGLDVTVPSSTATLDVSYNPAHPNPAANDPFLVLGAEKFDIPGTVSFSGFMDELRLSRGLRYLSTFAPTRSRFTADGNTLALYHFDEASGTDIVDASNGNGSPGVLKPGGGGVGASRTTDTPF